MFPLNKFDLTVKSAIICGETPFKGLEATLAPNPNQMNRLSGHLNGEKVMIAQRHGKGGMDFNKMLGGKVFAVAADGLSPVFEKADGKATEKQKTENGMPLFSSSGFYLLSSKEYPAIHLTEAFTFLRKEGEQVLMVTGKQFAAKQRMLLNSQGSIAELSAALESTLGDQFNVVAEHNAAINKRRKRLIDFAQGEAEERGEKYSGIEYAELPVSNKDGNPFAVFYWKAGAGEIKGGAILREAEVEDESRDDGLTVTHIYTAKEAVADFWKSASGKEIQKAVNAGQEVWFGFVQGNALRTSVSFRKKVANALADPAKAKYGDGVYILGSLKGWTRGIVSIMHSQHPKFPTEDYDSNYFVASCRQAEIGMNKKEGGGWNPPECIFYSMTEKPVGSTVKQPQDRVAA